MKFLALALKYFPSVLQAVVAVEQAIGSQAGATKKLVVLSAVTAAARSAETVDETHVQTIATLIDTTVGALNTAGVFGKPAAKPAA